MDNPLRCLAILLVVALAASSGMAQKQDTQEMLEMLEAFADEEFMEDPERIMAWVKTPRSVAKGEVAALQISIENARETEVFRLSSIDFEESFISGFKILELSPEPRNKSKSLGHLSLEYPIDIPAGESREFNIQLRAQKAGIYIGDADIYEGEKFLTRAAQMRVE